MHGVTNGAVSPGARKELSAVVVGMAIGALRKCGRRLEIALVVAVAAGYAAVLSEKRISCLGVVEAFELRHLRPLCGVVTRLARAFEAALVWICVAAGARGEGKPRIFHVI